MINLSSVLEVLPKNIKDALTNINIKDSLQEIRIKINKPLIFNLGGEEVVTNYICTLEDIKIILQRISGYSIYAFEEEIKQGYITIKGGHRIGLCGSCVMEENSIKTIKDIASINIRICKEVRDCSTKLLKYLIKSGRILNTIIISPPKCGKTTILRDLVRNISNGVDKVGLRGHKITVVDERSEIGACYRGIPQLDVGIRTDILDNCPKSEGMIMAIRSMAPEVMVADEIGTLRDMEAILMALNSGVKVISTIHGNSVEDLYKRQVFKDILANKVFERALVLSNKRGIATVEYIYDFEKNTKMEVYL